MVTDDGRGRIGLCGEFCQPCVYRSQMHNSCDYILITGHPRGCPAGEGCTRRELGTKKRETAPKLKRRSEYVPKLGQEGHLQRLNLYKQGLSDGSIAELLGVSATAVRMWRKAHSLPVNRHGQLYTERLELYHAGKTDKEIAEALNLTRQAIKSWRQARGLPANAPEKPEPAAEKPKAKPVVKPYGKENEQRRLALYRKGLSDSEVASACGVAPQVIQKWRRRRGLKANRPEHKGGRPVSAESEARRMDLWNQGLSDMAIAHELGVCCGTISKWRSRRNLPQNAPKRQQDPHHVLPDDEDQRRMALYNQGLTDAEMHRALGLTPTAVYHWRKKKGLTKNVKRQK